MKRLMLLRHAQTFSADSFSDAQRKLTPKGKKDAQTLGALMKKKAYIPDMVLCSTATRARETLNEILENLGNISTHYDQNLYNTNETELFQMIQHTDNKIDSLLILGHNPVMHAMASRLAAEDQSGTFINHLYMGYPPGTLTILEVNKNHWNDIQFHENQILDLLEPTHYNKTTI